MVDGDLLVDFLETDWLLDLFDPLFDLDLCSTERAGDFLEWERELREDLDLDLDLQCFDRVDVFDWRSGEAVDPRRSLSRDRDLLLERGEIKRLAGDGDLDAERDNDFLM